MKMLVFNKITKYITPIRVGQNLPPTHYVATYKTIYVYYINQSCDSLNE